MNVPNVLTFGRFALIPVYVLVYASGEHLWAFGVLMLAGATDVADGWLARRRGQVTPLGEMLDPLADKCMMLTVILSLLITGKIPWAAAIAMFIRDAGMIAGSAYFHVRGKRTVPANGMGKLTTVLFYAVMLLLFADAPYALEALWIVIAFSFVTSWNYVLHFRALNGIEKEHTGR